MEKIEYSMDVRGKSEVLLREVKMDRGKEISPGQKNVNGKKKTNIKNSSSADPAGAGSRAWQELDPGD